MRTGDACTTDWFDLAFQYPILTNLKKEWTKTREEIALRFQTGGGGGRERERHQNRRLPFGGGVVDTYLHPGSQVGVVDEPVNDELGGSAGPECGRVQSCRVARPEPVAGSTGFSREQQELGVDQGGRLRHEGDGSVQAEERGAITEAAQVFVTHSGSCRQTQKEFGGDFTESEGRRLR